MKTLKQIILITFGICTMSSPLFAQIRNSSWKDIKFAPNSSQLARQVSVLRSNGASHVTSNGKEIYSYVSGSRRQSGDFYDIIGYFNTLRVSFPKANIAKMRVNRNGHLMMKLKPGESASLTVEAKNPVRWNIIMIGTGLFESQSIEFSTNSQLGFSAPIIKSLGTDGIAPFAGNWSDHYYRQSPGIYPTNEASMVGVEPINNRLGDRIQVMTRAHANSVSVNCKNNSSKTVWVPLRILATHQFGGGNEAAVMPGGSAPQVSAVPYRGNLIPSNQLP